MNNLQNQNLDLTVAIPTYNGAERLPKILDKLYNQTGIERLRWEIIIVDNNSSDDTNQVIMNYQKIWHLNIQLRYFMEPEQGAAYARLRAVKEAKGELVAFLDDDNLPAPDWVAAAYAFSIDHPQAGAWSGQIHGDFEVTPPENFEKIKGFLAIQERGNQAHLFKPDRLILPPGAAFVIRKKVWSDNVPQRPALSGKLPGLFIQGDDYEPLLYIHYAGWEIWYNPAMHTYHQIPSWRLEKKYLLTLARGGGLCICHLRFINTQSWEKPFIFIRTILGNFRRLLRHIFIYNFNLNANFIARFETEFYLGSMISPFYYLRYYGFKNYKNKF
ncbi:glycosyltransferase family 2 protein [Calothrix membranacea FACHB-236]|nr:glycosyltransferase family 2 protein [Calothrix membranacea FACHB-236]